MKIRPELKPEDFTSNPLVTDDFQVKVRVFKDGSFVRSGEELIPKEVQLEYNHKTKLFKDKENRLIVSFLGPRAQRLFIWLLFEVENGKDFLWINVHRYMKENKIADMKTYRAAVVELCRYMFLFKHPNYKNVFWINPRYFFSGSLMNKYPNNLKYISEEPTPKDPTEVKPSEPVQEPEKKEPSEFRV